MRKQSLFRLNEKYFSSSSEDVALIDSVALTRCLIAYFLNNSQICEGRLCIDSKKIIK